MGRVRGFVDIMNRVFTSRSVKLPLPDTTEQKDVERVVKGEAAQVEIFGPRMKGFATSGPEKTVAIRRWLSANCFGDYYVRSGLSLQERELVTFCYLAAQGDTTAQMAAHAAGNLKTDPSTFVAGDLVFWGSPGSIYHVAVYIGGGRITHASDYSTGVITTSVTYGGMPCGGGSPV